MPYVDQLLSSGETIVRREHQHWIFPFYIAGRWVALAAVVTVLGVVLTQFVFRSDNTGIIGSAIGLIDTILTLITVVALVIAVVGFVYSIIQWQTQEYVLTTMRVIHAHGVINKQAGDSSLENITDAQILVPWLGRILGFGNLTVMTASEAGINQLRALRDPIGFKKSMMEAKEAHIVMLNTPRQPQAVPSAPVAAAVAPAPVAPAPQPPAAPAPALDDAPTTVVPVPPPAQSADDIANTLGRLAELRDSGAITPEEYEAKKQELLDRI